AQPDADRPAARSGGPAPALRDRSLSSSLGDLLEGDPGEVVVYLDGVATRRDELRALVDAFAGVLRDAKLSHCAIGVLGANAAETIAAWFAVWTIDGAFVHLNPRVPPAER